MSNFNYSLIDSHSHPQFPQYDKNREEVIKKLIDKNIGIVCVGTDLEMSKKAIELANKYDMVWASVGLHPNDVKEEEFDYNTYLNLAKNSKVVAVGETGLDYYRTKDAGLKVKQKEKFLEHIKIAKEIKKPVIIHCRDAHEDMIEILERQEELKGVIHSFTGTKDDAQKYFNLGFYIGLNGIITFARDYDETILNASLSNIILETDAPFLTPVPYRGKRNEPAYVELVGRKLSELKGIEFDEVAKVTTENARKLFNL